MFFLAFLAPYLTWYGAYLVRATWLNQPKSSSIFIEDFFLFADQFDEHDVDACGTEPDVRYCWSAPLAKDSAASRFILEINGKLSSLSKNQTHQSHSRASHETRWEYECSCNEISLLKKTFGLLHARLRISLNLNTYTKRWYGRGRYRSLIEFLERAIMQETF